MTNLTVPNSTLIKFLRGTKYPIDNMRDRIARACADMAEGDVAIELDGVRLIVARGTVLVAEKHGPALVKLARIK